MARRLVGIEVTQRRRHSVAAAREEDRLEVRIHEERAVARGALGGRPRETEERL